ncbi:DUF6286 domain-containing protein [Kitasatospora sp. NBC_01287]|uniref:DUF6286 domain-containing protein n=1 Tax=Kitasatospora sp. NBC_01287 TaxID=2903573 RepID=UPI00225AD264|nr:DUF6286 domain-containing protein [Kitasatospora sp. NBC_01287]MCX4746087.1 DUF6286 domain-containing protein [Kitasatospora sp. NBC_01287]
MSEAGPGFRVPRSPRTRAAALVAVVVLAAAAVLLYDAVSRWAGHRAGSWRSRVAHQLATRHLDTGWVLGCAALVGLFGLWLCVLALSSGGRRWLVLRQAPGTVIDRAGVAALLETRALQLPMVAAARVRVGRRRARVTIHGSADLERARVVLAAELARLQLLSEPALRVRGRPAKHRPPMS